MGIRTKIIVVLVCAVGVVALVWVGISSARDISLMKNPLVLNDSDDIRSAFLLHLSRASTGSAEDSEESLVQLYVMVKRLESGWEGFRTTRYYAGQYTSRHLLMEMYWEVAKSISDSSAGNRMNVIKLFDSMEPAGDSDLMQAYERAKEMHRLDVAVGVAGERDS